MNKNSWYTIKAKSKGILDISIHDEIGIWGVSAERFMKDLRAESDVKTINLSIHSPGGNVLDGFAMYNALVNHDARVFAHVEGVAASAASVILMAGDVITMPEDAFIMIHNAWGFAMGDSDEMRKMADTIDIMQNQIVNIYMKRTGQDETAIRDMMSDETWMNGADAVDLGFADTLTDAVNVAALVKGFDRHFLNFPVEYQPTKQRIEDITDIRSFEKYLRDAGISRKAAEALTARAKAMFDQGDPDGIDPDTVKQISAALDNVSIPVWADNA